jgi:FAD/FMN-containing dehydrogenase
VRRPPAFRGEFRTDELSRTLYSEGAGIFRIVPQAVAVPADAADLLALIRWAAETGTAVVPRGAGSGMPGGNVGPGVVLDLTRGFHAPLAVDPERRAARAGASVTYRDLSAAAAAHGLRLPPDPASGEFCTLGGMAATNAAGARSLKYGTMRRWTRALTFVTADGESGETRGAAGGVARGATAGKRHLTAAERRFAEGPAPEIVRRAAELRRAEPRTTKNSSGYGLADFAESARVADILVGSEGTLAVVTEVEVALEPVAALTTTLLVTLGSLDDIAPAVLALRPLEPSALELLDRTYLELAPSSVGGAIPRSTEAVLLAEFEGEGRGGGARERVRGIALSIEMAAQGEAADRLWALRRLASPKLAALPASRRSLQVVEDGCVPLVRLGHYVSGLREAARRHGFDVVIVGHAGDGHIHANLIADVTAPDLAERLGDCLEEVTALQLALDGTPSGEHGDGRLRAPYLARTFGAAVADLSQLVKRAWDPAAILNPGVKVPLAADASAPVIRADSLKVGPHAPPIPPEAGARLREIERAALWGAYKLEWAGPAATAPAGARAEGEGAR